MRTVNVVTVRSGWILQKIAERIALAGNKVCEAEWQVTHRPAISADINFYCDVQNCWPGFVPGSSMNIGLFTHIHADDPKTVNQNALNLDYIFHMANRYMTVFRDEFKYPQHRMNLMVPFESTWAMKKPTIGIFQRGKYEGKGYHFMLKFVEKHPHVCKNFKWIFVGNDWDGVATKMVDADILVRNMGDKDVDYPSGYQNLYGTIDYLLIPSMWEGGPISCLEAASVGVDIIAADVGWCREWADHIFTPGDTGELAAILVSRLGKKTIRANRLKHIMSYERCAKQIIDAAKVGKK